jgi:four helix bundle protein
VWSGTSPEVQGASCPQQLQFLPPTAICRLAVPATSNGHAEKRARFGESECGARFALSVIMPARTLDELAAYQFAIRFKEEVYKLIRESPSAGRDFKYRDQVGSALSGIDGNIAEGFGRGRATDFANFLVYALGSIAESKARVRDGILRGYFRPPDCATALVWADRCREVTDKLHDSQLRLIEQDRAAREREKETRRSRKRGGGHRRDNRDPQEHEPHQRRDENY